MLIRALRMDDLELIRALELRAGSLFHDVGMPDIAEHPVPAVAELARFVVAAQGWVVAGPGDVPVAFVLAEVVDGLAHVEQVSVDPAYARRRWGARLIDHVGVWAIGRGLPAVSLTTFRDVPWNAPYYLRLGFRELADAERGPELEALMAEEAQHGLNPADRVAMHRAN